MYGEYITIGDALFITVLSISIVFSILLIIAFAIMSFKYIFKVEEKKIVAQAPQQSVATTPTFNIKDIENDEDKIVAVMVATMEANNEDKDKIYKVSSVKEI